MYVIVYHTYPERKIVSGIISNRIQAERMADFLEAGNTDKHETDYRVHQLGEGEYCGK